MSVGIVSPNLEIGQRVDYLDKNAIAGKIEDNTYIGEPAIKMLKKIGMIAERKNRLFNKMTAVINKNKKLENTKIVNESL